MERKQTNEVVDTPPPAGRFWPAAKNFQEREKISQWRDISQGMHKLLEINDHGRNKYIPSIVFKL